MTFSNLGRHGLVLLGLLGGFLAACAQSPEKPPASTPTSHPLPKEQSAIPPLTPQAARERLERLHLLVGDWEASTASGAKVRVSYRLVSAGSVLVQTFTPPSGRETITVFHLDGKEIVATHYCAQGNQPRLRLEPSDSTDTFLFAFWDSTNLPNPRASHLHRLTLVLTDADHYSEIEEYLEDGQLDVTVLSFARTAASPKQ